ncbi:unnamed protein product [Echinostoma caproni]|uniref:Reverse transcriptase domain-containing protein n=1 Tax=Echinostoma caproni TaxID=27848 RepID=A0A182ZZP7_9TREM|nr:unnamed protein product [Echinostoma caproni]
MGQHAFGFAETRDVPSKKKTSDFGIVAFTKVPPYTHSVAGVARVKAGLLQLSKLLYVWCENVRILLDFSSRTMNMHAMQNYQVNACPNSVPPFGNITIGAVAKIRVKVPWPAAFEDGGARVFLEKLEDVAELAGIRTHRGKLTALGALLKGRARAVLDAARRGPEKMEWAAAKDVLIAGFDTPADHQEALRRNTDAVRSRCGHTFACRGPAWAIGSHTTDIGRECSLGTTPRPFHREPLG